MSWEAIAAIVGLVVTVGSIFLNTFKHTIMSEVDRKINHVERNYFQLEEKFNSYQSLSIERDNQIFKTLDELKLSIEKREDKILFLINRNYEDIKTSICRFHDRVDELEDSFARKK